MDKNYHLQINRRENISLYYLSASCSLLPTRCYLAPCFCMMTSVQVAPRPHQLRVLEVSRIGRTLFQTSMDGPGKAGGTRQCEQDSSRVLSFFYVTISGLNTSIVYSLHSRYSYVVVHIFHVGIMNIVSLKSGTGICCKIRHTHVSSV